MHSDSISAILVEDEANARVALLEMLNTFCPEVEVVGEAGSVPEGLSAIERHQPKLVFLDIQLGQERSFEILHTLPKINFHLIFVTAYQEFALEAFQLSAVDYLL
ncbi:MAG: response regulator, partial [Bacteroidota bacterium]